MLIPFFLAHLQDRKNIATSRRYIGTDGYIPKHSTFIQKTQHGHNRNTLLYYQVNYQSPLSHTPLSTHIGDPTCEHMHYRRFKCTGTGIVCVCAIYIIYLCVDRRLVYIYGRVACTKRARQLIHQSRTTRSDTPPAYTGQEHIRHVVFSTSKNSDILRRNIERVVYHSWRNLSTHVAFEVFTGNPSTPHTQGLAAADLPSMYTSAEALYPTALTFTFVNSDCISNLSFVETLDALLALETPFYALAIGRVFPPSVYKRKDHDSTSDYRLQTSSSSSR
jgi:hypothetical protein